MPWFFSHIYVSVVGKCPSLVLINSMLCSCNFVILAFVEKQHKLEYLHKTVISVFFKKVLLT